MGGVFDDDDGFVVLIQVVEFLRESGFVWSRAREIAVDFDPDGVCGQVEVSSPGRVLDFWMGLVVDIEVSEEGGYSEFVPAFEDFTLGAFTSGTVFFAG